MEASFKSRVEQVFGALLGASSQGPAAPKLAPIASSSAGPTDSSNSWFVSEVAISSNPGTRGIDESSGSESDDPCAARYEKFVKLAKRARRSQACTENDGVEGFDKENDLDYLEDLDDLDDLHEGRAAKRRRGEESTNPVSVDNGQQTLDEEEEECRQVRLMVGMDDTLDFEEEEDEYDKVAVGREGAGERVYMRELTWISPDMSAHTPDTASRSQRGKFSRDARANHAAAAARLKEDDRLATIKNDEIARMLRMSSSSGSTNDMGPSGNGVDTNAHSHPMGPSSIISNIKPALKSIKNTAGNGKPDVESSRLSTDAVEGNFSNGPANQTALQGDGSKASGGEAMDIESTLAHGENGIRIERKSKRVRFAGDDHVIVDKETVSCRDTQKVVAVSMSKNRYRRVPDHVRNPSKYTHYTLEWSDEEVDNKANLTAFQATQALARAREELETTGLAELPKSITFTPRSGVVSNKSNGEAKISTGGGFQQSQALVSFAEEVIIDNSPRREEAPTGTTSTTAPAEAKPARVFRKRGREEENDDSNPKGSGLTTLIRMDRDSPLLS